jgi:hypothetical protein
MLTARTLILFVIRAQSDCDASSRDDGSRSVMLIIAIARAVAYDAEDTPLQLHGRLTRASGGRVRRDGRGSPWKRRLLSAILLVGLVCMFALQGCAGLAVSESNLGVHRRTCQ